MFSNDDDIELTPEEQNEVFEFLDNIDEAIMRSLDRGISYAVIAGAMQAKVAQLYLAHHDPDIEGFEHLLQSTLDDLKSRPSWDDL